ncbi:CGNR zinc finger domain-containing protein [Dongia deserti]|uniref:CGNR zinc finger domain-containing protein n=1 Tax=Dongia deserti TaxID=2268030 RepID=UPI000E64B470|nr:ABATE domain-containing protein [Dongia deserti]
MVDTSTEEIREGFPFLGGRLWLDFLNSAPAAMGELIATPEDLGRWAAAAGIARDGRAHFTRGDLATAHALRSALRGIYHALSEGTAPPAKAIAEINRHLAEAPRLRTLESAKGHLRVTETLESDVFGRIASDLTDFIAGFEPHRLRACNGPGCSLVFYDTARNATRRWCSMAACGNRHKVARHRARSAAN